MIGSETPRQIDEAEQELFRRTVAAHLPELTEENIDDDSDLTYRLLLVDDINGVLEQHKPTVYSAETTYKVGKKIISLSHVVTSADAYMSVETIEPFPGQQPFIERFEVCDTASPKHVIFGGVAHPNNAIPTQELVERNQIVAARADEERELGLNIFTTEDLQSVLRIISQCNDTNRLTN